MTQPEQEYHEMILSCTHPSGVEEWYCPTCGRRFLMQWPPAYDKVILTPGDETAVHSGGKGGAQMASLPAVVQETSEPEVIDWPEFVGWADAHQAKLETLGGENA